MRRLRYRLRGSDGRIFCTGFALVAVGLVGGQYEFTTLPLAVVLTAVSCALGLSRRQPKSIQLVDIWCTAFVYLFGSEMVVSLAEVHEDFGERIASVAEGWIVAAFGASLIGYAAGEAVARRHDRRPRHVVRCRSRRRGPVLVGLSILLVFYVVLEVSPQVLLTTRWMREDPRLIGSGFLFVVAAMMVQGALMSQALVVQPRRAMLLFPIAVSLLSLAIIYGIGTRYFLGFFASGILFYAGVLGPLSRRRLALGALAVLVLTGLQGTMRAIRGTGLGDADAAAVAASLARPETFLSKEGILRVHAWIHEKRVFEAGNRAPEHAFLLYWWVPRSWWPGKPTMDGHWLAHEVMADGDVGPGHNVAGAFALPALLDLGPRLGIGICLLYGLALFGLERFAAMHRHPADPASVVVAFLPFAVFFGMRSPQTSIIFLECCAAVYFPLFMLLRGRTRPRRQSQRPFAMDRDQHDARPSPQHVPAPAQSVHVWPRPVNAGG